MVAEESSEEPAVQRAESLSEAVGSESTAAAAKACCEEHSSSAPEPAPGLSLQERMALSLGKSEDKEAAALRAKQMQEAVAAEKRRNVGVAVGSFLASCLFFFAQHSGISPAYANPITLLRSMEANSPPLKDALANGKPTVVDFYADWCENCKEMAPTMRAIEQQYGGRVNFVVIDGNSAANSDLVDSFRVDGIPHIALITPAGDVQTALIGNIPKKVMEADLEALLNQKPPPFLGYDAFEGEDHNIKGILQP